MLQSHDVYASLVAACSRLSLPVVTELPIMGIPVRFASNDPTFAESVDEAFGVWRWLQRQPEVLSPTRLRARFVLTDGNEGSDRHAPLTYQMPFRERVVLRTPGSVGVADATAGEVVAMVSRQLVADRAHFRYGVLEALTLALLTRFDRQPFHAAALVRNDTALLLTGPTGVGKSTLSYAAMRAGIDVLTDDAVYLQTDPGFRIWGIPGHLHLPVDAGRHFPELVGAPRTLIANGKEKIAVPRRGGGAASRAPTVSDAGICVLQRGTGGPRARRASPAEVKSLLRARREPGFDVFADTIGTAIATLVGRGGWVVTVGGAPSDVVPILDHVLEAFPA